MLIILLSPIWSFQFLFSIPKTIPAAGENNQLTKLRKAVQSGDIRYRLTEPKEIIDILGEPIKKVVKKDGGYDVMEISYPDVSISFEKFRRDKQAPFTIQNLSIQDKKINIGQTQKLVLRNNNDLVKLDNFQGFQDISLVNLDLKEEIERIASLDFDSLTQWPPRDKLPPGFYPRELLKKGKNPGLGIRDLHEQGINGKGIGIAIIDQPLLLGHEEYTSRIIRYDATGLQRFSPQMHGSPIVSIAVGKEIGVAPEAVLTYFAVPMWKKSNLPYIRSFRRIFQLDEILPAEEKIRAVSISTGGFSYKKGFEEWKNVLEEAENKGIFVATCDPDFLDYGTLTLIENQDPDDPNNYIPGKYVSEHDLLRIPTGNKTIASHRGINVYTFERQGGMSWAAPYLAGLAALAFQVNPGIKPAKIKELLVKTATKTKAGPIINPKAFIKSVKILQN
jgi:subtilisin family serine protease